jgi:virginiamycin B lyase
MGMHRSRAVVALLAAAVVVFTFGAVAAPAGAEPVAPAPGAPAPGGGGAIAGQDGIVEISLPLKGGSTHELAFAPDGGAVWVTQQNQSALVRIALPSRRVTTFPLPPGAGPHGIKFDAAGRLWITQEFANVLVALDVSGPVPRVLRVYDIPSPGAGPHGLDIGPDGATVWWTGKEGGVIGRLDPASGEHRIFALPDRSSTPIFISRGPDEAMWFTALTGSAIGRVTDAGRITMFPTLTPASRPIAVETGPDGRVWYSLEAGHRFGVIDPATGAMAEYPVPTTDAELAALNFDHFGRLWIQYNTPDKLGRVRPDETVEEIPIPTRNAVMHRIAAGPDGAMWFTELAADKVGRIPVPPAD